MKLVYTGKSSVALHSEPLLYVSSHSTRLVKCLPTVDRISVTE